MKNLLLAVVLPLLAVGCAANPEKTALQTQGINTNGASKVAFQNVRTEANPDGTSTLRGSLHPSLQTVAIVWHDKPHQQ